MFLSFKGEKVYFPHENIYFGNDRRGYDAFTVWISLILNVSGNQPCKDTFFDRSCYTGDPLGLKLNGLLGFEYRKNIPVLSIKESLLSSQRIKPKSADK